MTTEQLIKELRDMADIMKCLGDRHKTKILTEAVEFIEKFVAEGEPKMEGICENS